jgi:hypothetical protein
MSIRFNIRVMSLGVLLITLLFSHLSPAQISFERTYGGTEPDHGFSVQQTVPDGGYIVAGRTRSFSAGLEDVYIIKTDSLGDTLWTKSYGGTVGDGSYSVKQTSDGGYILTGYTFSFGEGSGDVYLIKTDSLGDTLWTRTYGSTGHDQGFYVQETTDGGFIITAGTYSFGAGLDDVYLIKTNSLGDTLWTKTYGTVNEDRGWSVQETTDGGYVITGCTDCLPGLSDVYIIKTDSLGDTLWTRTYGGSDTEYSYSIQETQDGGFIIAGATTSFGAGGQDVYLIKTDSSGDTLWTKTYGGTGSDAGYFVQSASGGSDRGYIITGYTGSFGESTVDVYLIKTDSLGVTLWTRVYGENQSERGRSVRETTDGGYIIGGWTDSYGAGDVYLIKTCPDGTVGRCKKNCLTFDDLDQTIEEAEIGNEGVRNSLQAKANNARRQYDRGNLKASGNVLCALLHEVDGQDGKHIDPESAQDLRECVTSLAENLGIPLPCLSKKSVAHVLYPNFPNPVLSKTMIGYEVRSFDQSLVLSSGSKQKVILKIYDLLGREVRTLVDEEQEAGYYEVEWNGEDEKGREASSGIYFYRLQSHDFTDTKKLILLK